MAKQVTKSKTIRKKQGETLEEAAIGVVNLFDQANTGGMIEGTSRGKILAEAIDDLRKILNRNSKKTILSQSQIDQVRRERRC